MKLSKWILLVLCAPVLGATPASADNPDWRNCNQEQDRGLQIRGCTEILARGIAETPKNRAIAFSKRATAYLKKGDLDRGIADLSQLIHLDKQVIHVGPAIAIAYFFRGDAYADKGDFDRAIADYNEAMRADPKRPTAYFRRGHAYARKGDFDRAIADYSKEILVNPKAAVPYFFRGNAYSQKRDRDRAIADFDEVLRLDPKFVAAFNDRGTSYLGKGDLDSAIADYDQALHLDPKNADALRNRGIAFELRGDATRARADFEGALAVRPGDRLATEGLVRLGTSAAPTVTAPCSSSRKRVALVVGNGAYAGSARLINPANDADDVGTLLREKLCFAVIEAKEATRETFSRKIGEFAEGANGAEVALFYYAGHGMQFQEINYLLPVDSEMANEYDAIHGNISAQDVITLLEPRAKVTLMFLDACRINPIEEEFKRRMASLGRGFGDTRGLAPMMSRSSETLVVFATRPNEYAADGTGRNSPFTEAFLKHIATPGKDIELVMRDIAASVRAKTNGRQTPQRLTELEHGLMLVPLH